MAEERLEAAVASEHAPAPAPAPQKEASPWSKERGTRIFRIITMTALPLLWIGFFYALYAGNEGTMSSYSLLILMFSLLNADVLVKGEKLPNKRSTSWPRSTRCCSAPGRSLSSSAC